MNELIFFGVELINSVGYSTNPQIVFLIDGECIDEGMIERGVVYPPEFLGLRIVPMEALRGPYPKFSGALPGKVKDGHGRQIH